MSKAKRSSLLLLSFATILTLFVAMSLHNLVLAPGQAFSLDQSQPAIVAANAPLNDGEGILWVLRGILAFALIFLPVYIIYSLRTPRGRRRLLFNVLMMLALLWIADELQRRMLEQAANQLLTTTNIPKQIEGGPAAPTAVFPAEPPVWVTIIVIAIASLLVMAFILSVLLIYRQRLEQQEPVLDKLAEAAQTTIQAIHAGGDFKLSIIQCYREMSRVVREEKGIARDIAMTPSEFEDVLIGRGLPRTSIDTLTHLFEQVRYGSATAAPGEEDLAIACLTEIVQACRPGDSLHED